MDTVTYHSWQAQHSSDTHIHTYAGHNLENNISIVQQIYRVSLAFFTNSICRWASTEKSKSRASTCLVQKQRKERE